MLLHIWNEIYVVLSKYIVENVGAGCILLAIWNGVLFLGQHFKDDNTDCGNYITFNKLIANVYRWCWCIYGLYYIELTFLTREAGSRTSVDLKFMGTYAPDMYSIGYMLENVLLYIPMGFLILIMLKHKVTNRRCELFINICRAVLLCLLLSLMTECFQHILARGYFQIDDIWLNTLGGFVGGLIACI